MALAKAKKTSYISAQPEVRGASAAAAGAVWVGAAAAVDFFCLG